MHSQNLPAESRAIAMRRRSDLVVSESIYQGERSWIVKDPVGMKYFRLLEPEFEIFEILSQPVSYREIKVRLDQRFPAYEFKLDDVAGLVNALHQNGLLMSQTVGQAQPLRTIRNKELKQKAIGLLMSVMSMRFPGVDPDRFLNWLYPKIRWLFSPWVTACCFVLVLSALLLVLQNLREFYDRLPEFEQFFNLKNVAFLGVILIVTKTIHEFGHGLRCKHFGGECHEIGFMMLVLMPAMYCNTSDSWILPNKWHRIAIGAAGMYVEVVLASICTFVWWYTHPCAIHYLSLNVIFLCGISTLLFNANPLLRYDGYYMLSDYLEIPNLGQKSKTALTSQLRVSVGMKPIESRLQPTRHQFVFALYSVASFVYRWFVMLMIFWFLTKFFEPYGLSVLGHMMIGASLIGMVVIPLFKVVKFFMYPGRLREVKRPHVIRTVSVLAVVFAVLFFVPFPHSIRCAFVIQPIDAQQLYVSGPGILTQVNFAPGDRVSKGDLIAFLENSDVAITLEGLRGQLAGFEADLAAYRLNVTKLADGPRMISETRLSILDVKKRIRLVSEQQATLKLVAQRSGIIIEPPAESHRPGSEGLRLVKWAGSPLEAENRSAFLERGTLFCLIGEPSDMKATLVIDESVAKFATADQRVVLMFDEHPGKRLHGVIESVSREPLQYVPRELDLQNGGSIATKPAPGGQSVPMITSYEATVQFDDQSQQALLTGFRGQAKVRVGSLPLGQRVIRYLKSIINFR